MLQKLPLVICSRHLFLVNVSQSVFRCVCNGTNNIPPTLPFILAYMQRPLALEHLTLLEATRSWSFSTNRKKNPCKQNLHHKIVRVYPQFLSITSFDSSSFEPFVGANFFYTKIFVPSLRILEQQLLKLFLIGITLKAHMLSGMFNVHNKNPYASI